MNRGLLSGQRVHVTDVKKMFIELGHFNSNTIWAAVLLCYAPAVGSINNNL
jgi:hypothetical protein